MSPVNKTKHIQDLVLNHLRKKRIELSVYLNNGVALKGRISSFDNFTFTVENKSMQSLVYKHSVSTIVFPKDVRIDNLNNVASTNAIEQNDEKNEKENITKEEEGTKQETST